MLVHFGESAGCDLPLLGSVLPSNQAHIERAIERVMQSGGRRIGLHGLTFKAGTDDLRESPLLLLARDLIEEGYDVKIYDENLSGPCRSESNRYLKQFIPDFAERVVQSFEELIDHAEVLVVTRELQGLLFRNAEFGADPRIVDLTCLEPTGPPRSGQMPPPHDPGAPQPHPTFLLGGEPDISTLG